MSIKLDINDYRGSRHTEAEWNQPGVEERDWGKEVGAIVIECDDPAMEKAILDLLTRASNIYTVSGDMMFTGGGWISSPSGMKVLAFNVEDAPENPEAIGEACGRKVVRA